MYMLAYTEEARACLQEMPKERRQDCVAALIRLAADPYAQPSTPVVRGKEERRPGSGEIHRCAAPLRRVSGAPQLLASAAR